MLEKNLKYYRLRSGLSKRELASRIGVSAMAISHYENGERKPEIDILRRLAGELGVKLADFAVITSDNPRTEDPMAIIEDILTGVKQEDGEYIVIEDRRAAIRYAMDIGKKDDIIILAGKGHETYQDIGGVKRHLDEREEVAAHLREKEETAWEN